MRTRCLFIAVVLLGMVGCAVLRNTPQQDYVWEMGHICDSQVSFWKMESVKADAR